MDKSSLLNKLLIKNIFLAVAFSVSFTSGKDIKEETVSEDQLFIVSENDDVQKYNYGIVSIDQDNSKISFSDLSNCNETQKCDNGGRCLHHVCVCLPGTSGPFCQTIDDCKYKQLCRNNEYTHCEYSVEKQKAFCRCRITEYRFDIATRTCRTCVCSESDYSRQDIYSYCEYQQGQQICVCNQGYSYNPRWKYCTICDCGENSTWCAFDRDGKQMCGCEKGFVSSGYQCNKCNCMSHGTCKGYSFDCICDEGYVQKRDVCVACSCGKHGECIFDNENSQIGCKCDPGYAVKAGKCEFCECGENSTCSFQGDQKVCECAAGFEGVNGFCADINECKVHNPCDDSMFCINNIGSYKCYCKEGFIPKPNTEMEPSSLVCEDIDECKQTSPCPQANTECINSIGSFHCVCETGYASRGDVSNVAQCEKTSTAPIYTLVMSVTAISLVVVISAVVYIRRK